MARRGVPALGSAAMEIARPDRPAAWLLWLLLALTAVRLLVGGAMGLTDDEAYYRLWSLAPDWGYLDHPPLVAWLMWLGRALAGDSAFGLRLLGPLLALGGSLALWRTARLLGDARLADRAVLLFQACPLVGIGTVILTPDTGAVLAWVLALWSLAEFERGRDPRWLLLTGLAAGLGLLSKYTVLALGAGILLWLLRHRDLRPTLRAWPLWAGGLLALLLFLPVVLWNREHDWISFAKQFGKAADWSGFGPRHTAELIGVTVLSLGVLPAPLAAWGFWRSLRAATPRQSLPALVALPFLLFLLQHSLHELVLGQWSAPLYPAFAILAAQGLALAEARVGLWRRWAWATLRLGVPACLALVALLYAYVAVPGIPVLARKETTTQTRGWPALAAEVEALRQAQGAAWIATHGYATTGQLAFRLPGVPVLQLDERERYLNLPDPPPALWRQPALFVEIERLATLAPLRRRFRRVEFLGTLERREGDQVLRVYAVYLLVDPKGDPLDNPKRDQP
jgi:4-amino-4-deoxy-L-arabinose transferase-like glycosyltransferase